MMSKPGQLTHVVPGAFSFPQQARPIGATPAEVLKWVQFVYTKCCTV